MNKTVEFFRTQIGKVIEHSPSAVGLWLKPVLKEVDEGKLTADFVVREEMTNPMKMLHGGIIALICDEMIGASIATLELPDFFPSVNLHTDFLYGAKLGDTITAKAEIIRKGKNIINTECKIYNSDNKLIAKASSNNIRSNGK
ncbi:MAG: PaaI family thioesterase [Chlorobi bacterium]|nr:PaaI family thioesterase [Chlorobiota bacterium]